MNNISIVTRVIAIVGAAAAVYFYFDLGNELEETRQQLQSEQQRLSQTQSRLSSAEAERDELAETAAGLEASLEEAQGQIALEQARAEELEEELESQRATIARVESEREEYRAEASTYRDRYISLRDDIEGPNGEDQQLILSLQRDLRLAEAELETARERLSELEGVTAANGEVTRTLNVVRGKVADVDPRRGFVVLDLGTDHDLQQGDELMVHRDGTFIARVRVSRSDATESIAQVLPGAAEAAIRRGDDVRITKVRFN